MIKTHALSIICISEWDKKEHRFDQDFQKGENPSMIISDESLIGYNCDIL
jgi:hypothetical protein